MDTEQEQDALDTLQEFNQRRVDMIAAACHDANKAYCQAIGDTTQLTWDAAPGWQKDSARNGVRFHLGNPDASASASHKNWLKIKLDGGWVYGPVKDAEKKIHPCIMPFDGLPREQQVKDHLFKAIVAAFVQVT